jgi:hypothetical protein
MATPRPNAQVAESLFRKATGDGREAVLAAILCLKTRAPGKRSLYEHGGIPGQPIEQFANIEDHHRSARPRGTEEASGSPRSGEPRH